MKPKAQVNATPDYQTEKHLRDFCELTSNEMSNLLGTLMGELRYALTTRDPKQLERAVNLSLRAGDQALELSKNLKYFAAHIRLDRMLADVSQLLLDCVEQVERSAVKKQIKMGVFVESSVLSRVDATALFQSFHNLLIHCANVSAVGGKLTVTLKRVNQLIEILIADCGQGYTPEETEKIFKPYFLREDPASYDQKGLNLAVARAIIEAHGGDIHVESAKGKGTTYIIRMAAEASTTQPSLYGEKRKHRRVSVTVPVEVTFPNRQTFFTFLTTLGAGGCFIRVNSNSHADMPPAGTLLSIKLILREDQIIEIPKARIAYRQLEGVEPGIGIEFLEMADRAMHILSAIVQGR